jgi:hypothetical protein
VRIQILPKIKKQICFYSTVTSINLLYLKTYVTVGTLGKYLQLEEIKENTFCILEIPCENFRKNSIFNNIQLVICVMKKLSIIYAVDASAQPVGISPDINKQRQLSVNRRKNTAKPLL